MIYLAPNDAKKSSPAGARAVFVGCPLALSDDVDDEREALPDPPLSELLEELRETGASRFMFLIAWIAAKSSADC